MQLLAVLTLLAATASAAHLRPLRARQAAGAADFGQCDPTMDFVLGRPGRDADEGTFLPVDDLVAEGQQDALNPNIITNRICDQLGNVCGAADDAIAACKSAQADLGNGPKDATTANAWNEALGFAGADINPDNAPKEGLVGHT